MKKHLLGDHGIDIEAIRKEEEREAARAKNEAGHEQGEIPQVQPTIPQANMNLTKTFMKMCSRLWALMMVIAHLPFSLGENETVRTVMHSISRGWLPPCGKTVARYMREEYHKGVPLLRNLLQKSFSCIFLHGTMDIWTAWSGDPFLGMTSHWITWDFYPRHATLSCALFAQDHTAQNMVLALWKVLIGFNIMRRFNVLTLDGASNNCAMMDFGIDIITCTPHTWNLVFQTSLLKAVAMGAVIVRIRKVCKVLKKSAKLATMLRKLQKTRTVGNRRREPLRVVLDVKTRWWSTSGMAHRARQLRNAIRRLIDKMAGIAGRARATKDSKKYRILRDNAFDEGDYTIALEEYDSMMTECEMIIRPTSGLAGSITSVMMSVWKIERVCNKYIKEAKSTMVQDYAKEVLEETIKRFTMMHPFILVATYLNPRYKKFAWMEADLKARAHKILTETLQEFVDDSRHQGREWEFNKWLIWQDRLLRGSAKSTEFEFDTTHASETAPPNTQEGASPTKKAKVAPPGGYDSPVDEPTAPLTSSQPLPESQQEDNSSDSPLAKLKRRLRADMEYYDALPVVEDRTFDIFGWWREIALKIPVLALAFRFFCAVQPSSVASERMFSMGGLETKRKPSALARTFNQVLCLQSWFPLFREHLFREELSDAFLDQAARDMSAVEKLMKDVRVAPRFAGAATASSSVMGAAEAEQEEEVGDSSESEEEAPEEDLEEAILEEILGKDDLFEGSEDEGSIDENVDEEEEKVSEDEVTFVRNTSVAGGPVGLASRVAQRLKAKQAAQASSSQQP
mmetsp:Transcript_30449/g.51185  ORF Transcript_30449/g.51185 Transcript_30449/m.51185 type:complete len:795 (-) Transcript_30449:99-2483(-)